MKTELTCTNTPINKADATVCYQPRYTVDRSDKDTVVQVELPGVSKENLNLTVEDKELLLEGVVASKRPESWKTLHRESRDRTYQLRLRLGEHVDQAGIQASLAEGILTLTIPKTEATKPRQIKIK